MYDVIVLEETELKLFFLYVFDNLPINKRLENKNNL